MYYSVDSDLLHFSNTSSEQRSAFRHRHRFKLFHLGCKQKQSNPHPLDLLIRVILIRVTQSPLLPRRFARASPHGFRASSPIFPISIRVEPAGSRGKIIGQDHESFPSRPLLARLAAGVVVGLAQLPFPTAT